MRTTATLLVLPLAAALSGCSDEVPTLGAPPPPAATPSVEPVDAAVVQSELRRAVAAMESHRNTEGAYTKNLNALGEHGFASSKVLAFLPYADEDRYCIEATSSTDTELVFHASDTAAAPREGRCPEG